MLSQASVSHYVHRGGGVAYALTSCLTAWCLVPTEEVLTPEGVMALPHGTDI